MAFGFYQFDKFCDLVCQRQDYKKRMMFYQNHIDYLTNGNVLKLFLQNFSPYYKGVKTKKARIMDLIFAFKQKFKSI